MSRYSLAVVLLVVLAMLLPTLAEAQKPGEIVFAKNMINPASPAGLTTEFKAGDPIYAVAYVPSSFAKLAKAPDAKKLDIEVFLFNIQKPKYDYQEPQEMQLSFSNVKISGNAIQQTYLPVDIVPVPGKMTAYGSAEISYAKFGQKFDGPVRFAEDLSKLEGGKQTIKVTVKCNYEVVAEGKFTIEGSDFSGYAQQSVDVNKAASGIQTASATMPKAAKSDKGLEAEMISALKASQTYKDRMQGQIMKLVIIDADWYIRRHELTGVILHRYIRAAVAIKDASGKCTVWQNVTFQQDYVSNKFQRTRFDGVGDPYAIPCENIK
jgi:hypothetical protein